MSSEEWRRLKLKEVIDLRNGKTRPQNSGNIPVYGGNGILDFAGEFNVDGETIIIGRVGAYCGVVYYENGRSWISDNALFAKPLDNNDAKFLFYFLKNHNLNRYAGGSSHPLLTQGRLNDLEVQLPPLSTQRRIATILSAFDDKIELNRRMNQTLEAMAQAIFKDWFVRFNFPGATGEMVETELGEVPVGWRVVSFEEVFNVIRGLSYKGAGLTDKSGTPMHNLNSVFEGGGYKYEGIKYYNGDFKEKHQVNQGDVIVANTEQGHKYLLIGFPAIVPGYFGDKNIISHHIYRVRPNRDSQLTSEFIYFLLLQPQVRDQVIGFCNGTTVNMLKINGLLKPQFAMPPKSLVNQFTEIARNLRHTQEENFKQSQTLTQLRDRLLPKLMRGEVEV